jgi:hypothetical protein
MNFPNATAADWTDARCLLLARMRRDGLDHDAAEEITQHLLCRMLTDRIPEGMQKPLNAARGNARLAARLGAKMADPAAGWYAMLPWKARRKSGEPLPVSDRGSRSLDPAFMADRAESLTRSDRIKAVSIARGTVAKGDFRRSVLAAVHAAAGVGPLAMHDAGCSPYIHGTGPGYTPPASGCRGLHGTDPRPAAAAAPAMAADPAAYRAALAEYYAGR